jgi:hypothetical protein
LNGTPENPHIIIPTKYRQINVKGAAKANSERNATKTSESQTSRPQQYVLGNMVFIDTPGLADTRGVAQDYQNINMILDFIRAFNSISRIILVINGTKARNTGPARLVTQLLCGSLPSMVLNNLMIVFTNCASEAELSFDVDQFCGALGVSKSSIPIVYLQNSGFSTKHAAPQRSWDEAIGTVRSIKHEIERTTPVSTSDFLGVYDARRDLTQILRELLPLVEIRQQATSNQRLQQTVQRQIDDKLAQIRACCAKLKRLCAKFDFTEELELQLDHYHHEKAAATTVEDMEKFEALFRQLESIFDDYAPGLRTKYCPEPLAAQVQHLQQQQQQQQQPQQATSLLFDSLSSSSPSSSSPSSSSSLLSSSSSSSSCFNLARLCIFFVWLWYGLLSLSSLAGAYLVQDTGFDSQNSDTLIVGVISIACSFVMLLSLSLTTHVWKCKKWCRSMVLSLVLLTLYTVVVVTMYFVLPAVFDPMATELQWYASIVPVALVVLVGIPLLSVQASVSLSNAIGGTAYMFVLMLAVSMFGALYVPLAQYNVLETGWAIGAGAAASVGVLATVMAISMCSAKRAKSLQFWLLTSGVTFSALLGLTAASGMLHFASTDAAPWPWAVASGVSLSLLALAFLAVLMWSSAMNKWQLFSALLLLALALSAVVAVMVWLLDVVAVEWAIGIGGAVLGAAVAGIVLYAVIRYATKLFWIALFALAFVILLALTVTSAVILLSNNSQHASALSIGVAVAFVVGALIYRIMRTKSLRASIVMTLAIVFAIVLSICVAAGLVLTTNIKLDSAWKFAVEIACCTAVAALLALILLCNRVIGVLACMLALIPALCWALYGVVGYYTLLSDSDLWVVVGVFAGVLVASMLALYLLIRCCARKRNSAI